MTNHDIQAKIDKSTELLNQAQTYYEHSDYNESERCAREALALLEPEAERDDLGVEQDKVSQKYKILETLAWAYNRLQTISNSRSDYALALKQAEIAIEFAGRIGDLSRKAALLGNIGIVHRKLSNYPLALEYHGMSLALNEELGDTEGVAGRLTNIGLVYSDLSDYSLALDYHGRALDLAEKHGYKALLATILGNIGNVHSNLSDYQLELEYCGRALAIAEELGNKAGVAIHLGNIGATYAQPKFGGFDADKAEEFLLKAMAISSEIGAKHHLYFLLKSLADLYGHEKRDTEALTCFKKFYELEKEVQSEEAKKQAGLMEQRKQAVEREKFLAVERARSQVTEELLHKTLPPSIADRVIQGETRIADHFESASILFADVVGFTQLSAKLPPAAVLAFMNFLFEHFDALAAKHGCERIKTIGDGYMAVCGAPVRYPNHAQRLALMALDMMEDIILPEEIREYLPKGTLFHLRIGLHCGEITAGLIGTGKLAYDIYGDAVNTAARMESHGEAGRIHVSEDFARNLTQTLSRGEGLSSSFPLGEGRDGVLVERGEVGIKGKGMMRTFYLENRNKA